jgi:hypothetical protein
VFPVRYELDSYILFGRNSVLSTRQHTSAVHGPGAYGELRHVFMVESPGAAIGRKDGGFQLGGKRDSFIRIISAVSSDSCLPPEHCRYSCL